MLGRKTTIAASLSNCQNQTLILTSSRNTRILRLVSERTARGSGSHWTVRGLTRYRVGAFQSVSHWKSTTNAPQNHVALARNMPLHALCMNDEPSPRKLSRAVGAESEAKYRSLFENSRDAIMINETSSGRFTAVSVAAVKMFGAKNQEQLLSLTPWELSPERQPDGRDSAEKAREMIETAIREGSHFFEWTHRRIGGEEFPADVLLTRMERNGKVFHKATVRDITERKQAENALREAHEKTAWLARFPEENRNPVVRVSLEGRVLYRNPAVMKLPGLPCEVGQLLSEPLLEPLRKAIAEAHQIEQDAELMGRSYSVSVAAFPADGYANIYGIDIAERKRAEERDRKSTRLNSSHL